jgi:ArsR family metal-binding transcriptional regulator
MTNKQRFFNTIDEFLDYTETHSPDPNEEIIIQPVDITQAIPNSTCQDCANANTAMCDTCFMIGQKKEA